MEQVDLYGIVGGREAVIIHDCVCYVGRNDNPSFGQYCLQVPEPRSLFLPAQSAQSPSTILLGRYGLA